MSQQFFGFNGFCWRRKIEIFDLGQQIIDGFRGVNSSLLVSYSLACAIDAEVDGDTVDPCIKSAPPVETGQSSIGFKEHILGNIKSILMCFDVSLGQLSRSRSGNG